MSALFSVTSEGAAPAVPSVFTNPVKSTQSREVLPRASSTERISVRLKLAQGRCTADCLSADDVARCAKNAESELRAKLRREKRPSCEGIGAIYHLGAPSVCNKYNRGYDAGTATVVTLVREAGRGWCVSDIHRATRGRRAGGGSRGSKLTLVPKLAAMPPAPQAPALPTIEAMLPAPAVQIP